MVVQVRAGGAAEGAQVSGLRPELNAEGGPAGGVGEPSEDHEQRLISGEARPVRRQHVAPLEPERLDERSDFACVETEVLPHAGG